MPAADAAELEPFHVGGRPFANKHSVCRKCIGRLTRSIIIIIITKPAERRHSRALNRLALVSSYSVRIISAYIFKTGW